MYLITVHYYPFQMIYNETKTQHHQDSVKINCYVEVIHQKYFII